MFTFQKCDFSSNQFPDIIRDAYQFILNKTKNYLKTPLDSTGVRPHFSVAVDKSTPHRDTNHAVLLIVPVNGVRMAIPIDAPIVYSIGETGDVCGGSGANLADQIFSVLKERLDLEENDFVFLRGM